MGSEKALAPDLVGVENFGDEAPLLGLGAVLHEGGTDDADAQPIGGLRGAGAGHLLRIDSLLKQRGALAAVFLGPVDANPAAVVELALPGTPEGEIGVLI